MEVRLRCTAISITSASGEAIALRTFDLSVLHNFEEDVQTLKMLLLSELPDDFFPEVDVSALVLIDEFGREVKDASTAFESDWSVDSTSWYIFHTTLLSSVCSQSLIQGDVIQPEARLVDTDFCLCPYCASFFDSSLLSATPSLLAPFTCKGRDLAAMGFLATPPMHAAVALLGPESPVQHFVKRSFLASALSQQSPTHPNVASFQRRLLSGVSTVLQFEEKGKQDIVRSEIDYESVFRYATEEKDRQMFESKRRSDEELVIIGLMRWFKTDFFRWCNKPSCENMECTSGSGDMVSEGMSMPNAVEEREGGASRVEVYRCRKCQQVTRFPRYNNPAYMVKHSRRGRCGEFANVFGMILRTMGFDVRYVLDFTDHVWVEVWIESLQRFVHCDPCERALDTPLMYESGWNKKLSHVLSFSRYGVEDATSRYSRKLEEVIPRRNNDYQEAGAQAFIKSKDSDMEREFIAGAGSAATPASFYTVEFPASLLQRLSYGKHSFTGLPEISSALMSRRKAKDRRELQALQFLPVGALKPDEMRGRQSGDVDWRRQRGEIQSSEVSSELETCGDLGISENALCTTGSDRDYALTVSNMWNEAKASDRLRWLHTSGLLLSTQFLERLCIELPLPVGSTNHRLLRPFSSFTTSISINGVSFPIRKEGYHAVFISHSNATFQEDGPIANVQWLQNFFTNSEDDQPVVSIGRGHGGGILLFVIDSQQPYGSLPEVVRSQVQSALKISTETLSSLACERKIYFLAFVDSSNHVIPQSVRVFSCGLFGLPLLKDTQQTVTPNLIKLGITRVSPLLRSSEMNGTNVDDTQVHPFERFESLTCSQPKHVISSRSGESEDAFLQRVHSTIAVGAYVGFSLLKDSSVSSSSSAATAGLTTIALLFDSTGLPLRPHASAVSHLFKVDSALDIRMPEFDSEHVSVSGFYDIGGGQHGDTIPFDASELLFSSFPVFGKLSQVTVWAGDSLVNGLQCQYRTMEQNAINTEVLSPIFSSTEGNPRAKALSLQSSSVNRRIREVHVRAGALIDGLSLVTDDGEVWQCGGHGGELHKVRSRQRFLSAVKTS